MMHIVWRFRAKPARVDDFRCTYGETGEWAKLFGRATDYRDTVLLQDTANPLVFVVIDRWATSDGFASFRQKYGRDYERLDERCRDLTDEETRIGVFTDEVECGLPEE
jgi:hypothetical protein